MTISVRIIFLLAALLVSVPVFAMNMSHDGKEIRTVTVDGATITYKLIDMRESMKKIGEGHGAQTMATHHLMIYAKGPDGPVKGKAGYAVTGPDAKTEKVMCMAMNDGFGADIHMASQGAYTIKVKVAGQGKTLMDEFTYTLEH